MTPFAGPRAGERHARAHLAASLVQAFDKVVWEERAIARDADDPLYAVLLLRQPIETGKDPGQRAGKVRHGIGHHGQAGIGETLEVAIGVDDDAGALCRQRCQHAVENRYAANLDARFVTAAHAPREAAGENEAESRGNRRHHPEVAGGAGPRRMTDMPPPLEARVARSRLGTTATKSRSSLIMHRRFAPVFGAFLFNEGEVLIKHNAIF